MSKVLSLLHWPVPLRTILFNCLLVFYLNLPEKCNKHWVILPCIQYLPPYRFNYRHYTNDIDNMVSQKIFTLLIVFSNLYLISSNVTINIWKWLLLFSECHFLKFYTIMKQEFLWTHVKLQHLTNKWVRGRVIWSYSCLWETEFSDIASAWTILEACQSSGPPTHPVPAPQDMIDEGAWGETVM